MSDPPMHLPGEVGDGAVVMAAALYAVVFGVAAGKAGADPAVAVAATVAGFGLALVAGVVT